jgi:DNA-binding MarR family transcriptional regulator
MPRPEDGSASAQTRTGTPEPQTAHLDAGLGNVLFDVWLVSRAATALIDDAVRAAGIDADEFAIYSVLASTRGMTPTELAHWMAAPATTVSSYVKRFERRGHVRKVPNPDDGRSYRVQLTAAGRRVHHAAGELFRPTLHEVTRRLGPGASDTHRQLRTLHQILGSNNDDQPISQ